jgi:hypothetical protein
MVAENGVITAAMGASSDALMTAQYQFVGACGGNALSLCF